MSHAGKKSRRAFVRLFKPQFAAMVENGTKLQTVRPTPKRLPQPGDRLSLRCWTGAPYRSKQRVLREAVVDRVRQIEIDSYAVTIDGARLHHQDEEAFAMADGFLNVCEMTDWFRNTHGLPFRGIVLSWVLCTSPKREDSGFWSAATCPGWEPMQLATGKTQRGSGPTESGTLSVRAGSAVRQFPTNQHPFQNW